MVFLVIITSVTTIVNKTNNIMSLVSTAISNAVG